MQAVQIGPSNDDFSALEALMLSTLPVQQPAIDDEDVSTTCLPDQSTPTDLEALQRIAYLGEQQKRYLNSTLRQSISQPVQQTSVTWLQDGAAPLSSLKERDLEFLIDLFHREDIYDIEVDISQMLLRLLPEPCWEENPFDFLHEFM